MHERTQLLKNKTESHTCNKTDRHTDAQTCNTYGQYRKQIKQQKMALNYQKCEAVTLIAANEFCTEISDSLVDISGESTNFEWGGAEDDV